VVGFGVGLVTGREATLEPGRVLGREVGFATLPMEGRPLVAGRVGLLLALESEGRERGRDALGCEGARDGARDGVERPMDGRDGALDAPRRDPPPPRFRWACAWWMGLPHTRQATAIHVNTAIGLCFIAPTPGLGSGI